MKLPSNMNPHIATVKLFLKAHNILWTGPAPACEEQQHVTAGWMKCGVSCVTPGEKFYGQCGRWNSPLLFSTPAPTNTVTTLIFMYHICLTRSWDVFTLPWLSKWIINQLTCTLKIFPRYKLDLPTWRCFCKFILFHFHCGQFNFIGLKTHFVL